ncbi:MAG: transporter substrate-binding protein, partial [Deltaproteobacteria bacterium]|nr:transporter substrate-binding protein [Deltaproteobacteria bacterium]
MAKRKLLTRRDFIKAAGVGAVTMGVAPTIFIPRQAHGASKELKILVWSHFVPRFDKEWYDGYVQKWGQANGVKVTVDHINLAEIPSRTAAEISASQGHDLIEWIAPPSQFEPSVLNLGDVVKEAEKRYGKQHPLARRSTYNPNSKVFYSFCPGWTIDPGCYRKSLWEKAGKGNGPETWEDLITYGGKIKKDQGIQLGIGLSQELDSNMA